MNGKWICSWPREQTTIALTPIALQALDIPAVPWTGAQAGIVTDRVSYKAKIKNYPTCPLRCSNDGRSGHRGRISGQTHDGQITTFGRGGSDLTRQSPWRLRSRPTSARFIRCGRRLPADPRVVPGRRKLAGNSTTKCWNLPAGRQVMQSRSVEFAKNFGVPFEVRSSLNDNPEPL